MLLWFCAAAKLKPLIVTDFPTPVDRLPEPDDTAAAVCRRLQQRIVDEIESHGPIGFDRYWEMALYEPGLGYYSAGAKKFGPNGDFITAPELGTMFAQCLAAPVAATLEQLEDDAEILEIGAVMKSPLGPNFLAPAL